MITEKNRLHLVLPASVRNPQRQYMQWQLVQKESLVSAFMDELAKHYEALTGYQEALKCIAQAFTDLLEIEPEQCEQTIEALVTLRSAAMDARIFLNDLSTKETEQIRPYGAIAGLYQLDYFCTHMALSVVRFKRICRDVTLGSVEWHIRIRGDMPRLLTSYENAVGMIEALAEKVIEAEQTAKSRDQGADAQQRTCVQQEEETNHE